MLQLVADNSKHVTTTGVKTSSPLLCRLLFNKPLTTDYVSLTNQTNDYNILEAQCDAENKRKISKCRQCCNTDNCNQAWITAGAAGSTAMSNTNWAVEPTDPIPDPMPEAPVV